MSEIRTDHATLGQHLSHHGAGQVFSSKLHHLRFHDVVAAREEQRLKVLTRLSEKGEGMRREDVQLHGFEQALSPAAALVVRVNVKHVKPSFCGGEFAPARQAEDDIGRRQHTGPLIAQPRRPIVKVQRRPRFALRRRVGPSGSLQNASLAKLQTGALPCGEVGHKTNVIHGPGQQSGRAWPPSAPGSIRKPGWSKSTG